MMRYLVMAMALSLVFVTGCSKREKPVVVDDQLQAEQKQVEEQANQEERAMQKQAQFSNVGASVEDQERAMQQQQRR
jgi:hypothetical protein